MVRRVFYSFEYDKDVFRVSQVRNIGAIEDNPPVTDNDWETVKRGGDAAIERWIDGQLKGRTCSVVLIGATTAGRPWIDYEIKKSWGEKKGLFGVHIHNLKSIDGKQAFKGNNPFNKFNVAGRNLSNIVKTYDPPYSVSTDVYAYIKTNLESWVEEAIKIRNAN